MDGNESRSQEVLAQVLRPTPGLGLGWTRVAEGIGKVVPPSDIGHIWIFPPLRRDGREWGTAVVAKRSGDGRFVVLTATYMLLIRGRQRGQGRVEVREVGEGPDEVVHDVVRRVQDRAGEGEPPIEIAPDLWFPPEDDESTAQD